MFLPLKKYALCILENLKKIKTLNCVLEKDTKVQDILEGVAKLEYCEALTLLKAAGNPIENINITSLGAMKQLRILRITEFSKKISLTLWALELQ